MKMMKRLILTAIVAIVGMCQGCTDFLSTIPDNRTEIDEPEKVAKLLVNAYPRRTYAGLLEARTDEMVDFGTTSSGAQQTQSYEFMRAGFYWMPFVETDSDDTYERFWEDCYRSVASANFALEALDKYEKNWKSEDVKAMRAEAKVCRAYAHFMLLAMFSNMFDVNNQAHNPGVPYVEVPEDRVFKQYDRETVAAVLGKISSDLFSEIDNLPGASGYKVPKFHFTRDAALAFATRFCLYTHDWNGAIQYANRLLPTAGEFEYVTNPDGSQSRYVKESDNAFETIKNALMDWPAYSTSGTNIYKPGQYFSYPDNNSFLLSTETTSVTWRAFLGRLLTRYAHSLEYISDAVSNNPSNTKWALQALQLSGDHETTFWVKYFEDFFYIDEAAGIGYTYVKTNLFRLEEVLLSRAEAKVMLAIETRNQKLYDSAVDDLNMYISRKLDKYDYVKHRLDRNRIISYYAKRFSEEKFFTGSEFNKPAFQSITSGEEKILVQALIACTIDFRRVEFMFEGLRYFDILRWNIPIKHTRSLDGLTVELNPDDDNRVLQIPESALQSGLKLNPMKRVARWPGISYTYGSEN